MRFEVSGHTYDVDLDPVKMTGAEIILIDDQLKPGWAQRWAARELDVRDIIVLTFLAAQRAGDERPFEAFVKTIAPLTFRPLPLAESAEQPAKPTPARPRNPVGAKVRAARKAPAPKPVAKDEPAPEAEPAS